MTGQTYPAALAAGAAYGSAGVGGETFAYGGWPNTMTSKAGATNWMKLYCDSNPLGGYGANLNGRVAVPEFWATRKNGTLVPKR